MNKACVKIVFLLILIIGTSGLPELRIGYGHEFIVGPYVSVEPQTVMAHSDSSFEITIELHNFTQNNVASGLMGFQLALVWNTSLIEPVSWTNEIGLNDGVFNGSGSSLIFALNGFYDSLTYPNQPLSKPYTNATCYWVAVATTTGEWWGDGVVASIVFQVNVSSGTRINSSLQLVSTEFVDYSQNFFTTDAKNSSLVIEPGLVGDLNGDGKVSLLDLQLLANAYNSKPGDPNWNPAADLAAPFGIISLTDLVTMAMHYGQHNP